MSTAGANVGVSPASSPEQPQIFHNSKLAIMLFFPFAPAGMLCLPLMIIIAFTQLNNFRAFLGWLLFGVLLGFLGLFLWRTLISMWRNNILLDDEGVHLRFYEKGKLDELSVAWPEIAAVKRQRDRNASYVSVVRKDGSGLQLSSYTFLRPVHIGKEIAKRRGIEITRG
jgi:hypothetical protein